MSAAFPSFAASDGPASQPGGPPQHLWSAFEHALIGMALIGPDNRPLRVNQALSDFLGYTVQELFGLTLVDVVHPDDLEEERRQRALLLSGCKSSYRREKRYLHKGGHVVWGDFSCTLVRDAEGRPLHYVAQVQDITRTKVAQLGLRQAQALVALAVQLGRVGAWAWDVGAARLVCSDELCAILEARPPFAPTPREAYLRFAPEYRGPMHETLQRCLAGGSPFDVEAQVLTMQERRVWVRVICEAEWDDRGRVVRLHGALQDISQAKHTQLEIARLNETLEERVRQRTGQLEHANEELEAFAYSIAHDLRGPMTSLAGFSRLLERNLHSLDGSNAHYFRRIQENVRHMSELTDALLSLARLSGLELAHAPVDLAELARQALRQLRELEPQRPVVADIPASLPATGDRRLLQQVMANLVGNAWKFSRNKPATHLRVAARRDADGQQVFLVEDRGVGFDMRHAGDLFGAFRRLHTSAEFEGTGIGLALVRKIVVRHGGRVWASAQPGAGATIYFTLNSQA